MNNIDSAYALVVYEHLLAKGHDPSACFGRLPADGARLSVHRWKKLLTIGEQVTGDRPYGLRVAELFGIHHFGLFGYLLLNCPTLLDAMAMTQRYATLVSENNPSTLSVSGDEVLLAIPQVHGWVSQASDEIGLGGILQFVRAITGSKLFPLSVDFMAPEPSDTRVYEEFFGCSVRFGQSMPAMRFPADYLRLACPNSDPEKYVGLDALASRRLAAISPLPDEIQDLRDMLVTLIRLGQVRAEDLAMRGIVSVRTLHRRLHAHGLSYQMLLDLTRRQLAEQYLLDPRISLAEIPGLIGFSEQSAFTRAFTNWAGDSPGQWRRLHVLEDTISDVLEVSEDKIA